MRKENLIWGLLLILIGGIFFVDNIFDINLFSMKNLWPVFVLGLGLIFEISYFIYRNNAGVLVPGGILTTLGVLFFFETFTGWSLSEYTWPVYPLSVAAGLFQLYLFGCREKGLLIPVFILTAVSGFAFAIMLYGNLLSWLNFNIVIGAAIMLAGLGILVKGAKNE